MGDKHMETLYSLRWGALAERLAASLAQASSATLGPLSTWIQGCKTAVPSAESNPLVSFLSGVSSTQL